MKRSIKMSDLLEKHGVKIASNQIEFSLLRQLPEQNRLLEEMKKRGIACLACKSWSPSSTYELIVSDSPLAMGRLTGKYNASNPIPSGRRYVLTMPAGYNVRRLTLLIGSVPNIVGNNLNPSFLNWVIWPTSTR